MTDLIFFCRGGVWDAPFGMHQHSTLTVFRLKSRLWGGAAFRRFLVFPFPDFSSSYSDWLAALFGTCPRYYRNNNVMHELVPDECRCRGPVLEELS